MQISSEKPGVTAESRMRTHRGWGIFLATWLVFSLTVMHGDYVTLALDGDVVMVTPEATLEWRQWVKPKNQAGFWRYHYEVRGTSQGRVLEDEVGSGLYHQVNAGTVNQIPFLVSNLRPSVQQYGTEPMTNEAPAIFSVIGALLLLLIYPLAVRATRPWYDRAKFNETVGGRLSLAV